MPTEYTVANAKETVSSIAQKHQATVENLLALNPGLKKDSPLKVGDKVKIAWITYTLKRHKVVAVATDKYLTPITSFPDKKNLPAGFAPRYGQDITSGMGRSAPRRQSVGKTVGDLKPKMEKLLTIFAGGDKSGMAKSLFSQFLKKQSAVGYFEDKALNAAAAKHKNILDFCAYAVSGPNSPKRALGKTRIHQALKNAHWDINTIRIPTDLGVPAFNLGSKYFSTDDFNNGLGLMINGVQHAYVVATAYDYNEGRKSYRLKLKFIFYDVFGLDDDDVNEFGASSDDWFSSNAGVGITAWWQLQHQHGYQPLVTRIIVEKSYEVPAQ